MKNTCKKIFIVLMMMLCFFFVGCDLVNVEDKKDTTEEKIDDEQKETQEVDEYVTITFDGENKQSVIKGGKALEIKANEKEGYDFIEWTLDGVKYDFDTPVTKDINLISKYQIKEFKVTFKNGESVEEKTVEYGGKVTKPSDPEQSGQTFVGWYCGGSEFDFNTEIKSNYTLTAHFATNTYKVTFIDGTNSEIKNVEHGKKVSPIVNPTKTGYTFKGWYLNDELYNFDTIVTTDLTLVAKFEINTYTITFNADGTKYTSSTVEYNNKVAKPATDPSKTGYSFKGWYNGNVEYDFNSLVTSDLTLEAKFEVITFVVTFDNEGTKTTKDVNYGANVSKITDPTKTGYTFKGWYNGSTLFDFNTKITSNITLTAVFEKNSYKVNFKVDGNTINTVSVDYGKAVSKPADPEKTGYTFVNWTLNGKAYDFKTVLTGNIDLVAVFTINTYTVTFENNGSTYETKTVEYNKTVSTVTNPSKTGYTFNYWTLNNVEFDFNTKITSDITLVANYSVQTFQIVYMVDGNQYTTQTVAYNQVTTKPTTPVKSGYTFNYWLKGTTEFSFDTKITENMTLTAKFTENESGVINVTYDFGYDCYQTKADLRAAYYTDFYNFLATKGANNFTYTNNGSSFTVDSLSSFLEFLDTWTIGNNSEMQHIGNQLGSYYVNVDVGGTIENQSTDKFVGWCWQNGKYHDFLEHLMTFFAYWRTDEGYTTETNHGNDFFASSWAAMVDTAKFFHFTSANILNTYSWFKSERVHYALDHIPGVGYVTLTYSSTTPITLPTDVTRPNNTFLGWYDSNGNAVTTVSQSMTVYAKWCVYTIRAEAKTNGYTGSETNWYCATPSQTSNGYLYGYRLVIAQSGDEYVVSQILGIGEALTGTYAYRIVNYVGDSYQTFDSCLKIGLKVSITTDGDYLIFNFYE